MSYDMSSYNINGNKLFVREEGKSDRQVILLIHGWSSSWFAMSPLMPFLKRRYRCLAVDLPGFGQSPRLSDKASIAAYADMMAELVKSITDKPVIIVGHSMGGMIGLEMALRFPDIVERLVLLCPTITGRLSLFINIFISPITVLENIPLVSRLVGLVEPYFLNITNGLMRPASFSERSTIAEDDYQMLRSDARNPGQGRMRGECFWAMRRHDLSAKIGQIKAPVLAIWGMEDNTVPLRDASILASELPDADLRIVPLAGHWPQFEATDQTRRYISAFLGTPIKLLQMEF